MLAVVESRREVATSDFETRVGNTFIGVEAREDIHTSVDRQAAVTTPTQYLGFYKSSFWRLPIWRRILKEGDARRLMELRDIRNEVVHGKVDYKKVLHPEMIQTLKQVTSLVERVRKQE